MNRGLTLLGGIGIGAALMYVLDPDRGRRRRALTRDKLTRTAHKLGDGLGKASRDLRNRAQGLVAETRLRFAAEEVPDETLVARVRSALGRYPVHQRALEITAEQGRVTLGGLALASEVDDLLACVAAVRGVREVENRMEVRQQAGNIPSLQGQPAPAAAS